MEYLAFKKNHKKILKNNIFEKIKACSVHLYNVLTSCKISFKSASWANLQPAPMGKNVPFCNVSHVAFSSHLSVKFSNEI